MAEMILENPPGLKSKLHHNSTKKKKQRRDERKVLEEFYQKLLSNQQDLPPEFAETINDHFWDIVGS